MRQHGRSLTDENAGIIEENVEELTQETAVEVTTEVLADEVTADITTDLVKENPYRYSGYYFDRKTQFYYLQARYYDPRIGRFISMDPLRGDMTNPLSLNRYVYGLNNPINYIDPTGHMAIRQVDNFFKGFIEGLDLIINISAKELLETVNAALDTGKMLLNGTITGKDLVVSIGQSIVRPFTNLYNNFNLVMRDKPREPRDYEVYKYGESTGEVITIAAGLVAGGVGFKAIVKKLKDSLTNIYNKKKITSGNNKTHANSNQGYSGDAVPCNCFTAGTEILTDDGQKPIEDIEVGDKVLAKNTDTGEIAYKEVTELFRNTTDKTYNIHIGEEIITATGGHPFWVVDKGWVYAENLVEGDKLETDNGTIITIEKIIVKEETANTYNFTVEDFHTYYVSSYNILVHNTSNGSNCKFEGSNVNIKGISNKLLDGKMIKLDMFEDGKYKNFRLEKDRALNSGAGTHGGSYWKLKDTRSPGSYWTLDKDGNILRYKK